MIRLIIVEKKNPIVNAASKYQNHHSIKIILSNCKNHFYFKIPKVDDVENKLKRPEPAKHLTYWTYLENFLKKL